MSYPPGQGSGQGQDDWGTVPNSGAAEGSRPNLNKGDQSSGQAPDEYAPTQFGPSHQGGPSSDPYGQNPYGQNPYGQSPYGQDQYGQNPYGQDQYGQNPYGSQPGGQGFGAAPGQDPYGQPPVTPPGAQYGQANDPYQAPAYGSAYGSATPYGAAQYGGYGYGTPAAQSTNGKAIAAMVCGIVGVISLVACFFFSFFLSIPIGIAAVVLGFLSRRDIEQSNGTQTGAGMGLTGIITGALSILGGVVWVVLFIIVLAAGGTDSYYY
ncbi:DUF4190 domain-containing protein [Gordonia sp. zg691]|uniref:DUF4190 domain-containing protein n=1 Tax=Gordonia jinghuaiqii TaxID=2758710 RepID=UPI0016627EFE|nr:DUF4190 domain-containing protein [Gordonia jinghuaiqii]MBD0862270.1 DUF4190 domain-containing protein [Gordonia jinghuaiqii]